MGWLGRGPGGVRGDGGGQTKLEPLSQNDHGVLDFLHRGRFSGHFRKLKAPASFRSPSSGRIVRYMTCQILVLKYVVFLAILCQRGFAIRCSWQSGRLQRGLCAPNWPGRGKMHAAGSVRPIGAHIFAPRCARLKSEEAERNKTRCHQQASGHEDIET